ncbi:MAG: hypothetical protein AMXMBFR81_05530 [Chthonomonas sp.]
MLPVILACALAQQGPIVRDGYGVPHIQASTLTQAFEHAGYAVAQDRLWQMENSRRLARGRMAEVFGPNFFASDREVALTGYTDEELRAQLDLLRPELREVYTAYAKGVNAWIAEAKGAGKLPPGYGANGFEPEPWSEVDSVAIAVRMAQLFGSGGGGELRNLAALQYFRTRQPIRGRELDALDDLLPNNDPRATTTVSPEDDPLASNPPKMPSWSRADTEKQLAAMPMPSLLELVPAVRLQAFEETQWAAQETATPYKWGSYAIVVGKERSATGRPWLLSGPQMGHTVPSIVHELSISTPDVKLAGMDVPGVPALIIGHTDKLAWGLTTGVADLQDVYYFHDLGSDRYRLGDAEREVTKVERKVMVKGEEPRTVVQQRTEWGPVLLHSRGAKVYFARRTSYWKREMESWDAHFDLYKSATSQDVARFGRRVSVAFNFFYATTSGEIGWRYLGRFPQRKEGYDARLPLPSEAVWQGDLPFEQMPHARNPKSGLIANWNNKPVAWWPNMDTPAWGRLFRNAILVRELTGEKLGPADMERAVWTVARRSQEWDAFAPIVRKGLSGHPGAQVLLGYDGWRLDGLVAPRLFELFLVELRKQLFEASLGNFLNPEFFNQALQPGLMLDALEGLSKVDYLNGRTASQVVKAACDAALARWTSAGSGAYIGPTFRAPTGSVPYPERGTYIQIVELRDRPVGRNVLPPGVAESGPHADDQSDLARAWLYKAMGYRD